MNRRNQWLFEAPLITRPHYDREWETEWESATGSADYPSAEWMPAATANFKKWTNNGLRPIDKIVIHITDVPTIGSTINTFQNPASKVSAHYVVGQDGRIVQMVQHNDIAYHASTANGSSIGIEHVACTGLNKKFCPTITPPTQAQYCSSAALVNWLCNGFDCFCG